MDFYKKCNDSHLPDLDHLTSIYRYLQDKESMGVVVDVRGSHWGYIGDWEYFRWSVRLEFWTGVATHQRVIAEATWRDRLHLVCEQVWAGCPITSGGHKGAMVPVTFESDGTFTVHTYEGVKETDYTLKRVNVVWDFNVRRQVAKEAG